MDNISTLLKALQDESVYPHPVNRIELIETHISWVFLTGEWVYKIKKPVNLGFLDFSTLEKRHFFCHEEVRLNKRLAEDYYQAVVKLTGSVDAPVLDGDGEAFEYAVKMRQFSQQSQLDRKLSANQLRLTDMTLLANKIADFHQSLPPATSDVSFGDLSHVHKPVMDCYQTILQLVTDAEDSEKVKCLQNWSKKIFSKLKQELLYRKSMGFIRECHGDLHLRNIAIHNDEVIVFDCIEFNADFRWIDVMSEIAFLIMDLDDHARSDLAYRFLNDYLETTGDYQGLTVLRYYLVYRAIVRAMVSAIRLGQGELDQAEYKKELQIFHEYLQLAEQYTHRQSPALILTSGLSGSGKTYLAKKIAPQIQAIHIRSDVERKRLFALDVLHREQAGIGQGIYNSNATQQTYEHLLALSQTLLQAGFNVLIDATFLKKSQRQQFYQLASSQHVAFLILNAKADKVVMKQRVLQRVELNQDASDADLSVLEYQLKNQQVFTNDEKQYVLTVNMNSELDVEKIVAQINNNLFQNRQLKKSINESSTLD